MLLDLSSQKLSNGINGIVIKTLMCLEVSLFLSPPKPSFSPLLVRLEQTIPKPNMNLFGPGFLGPPCLPTFCMVDNWNLLLI